MSWVAQLLGAAWAAWVLGNVLLFLLCAAFLEPRDPSFNGFRVYVPWQLRTVLSEAEFRAVTEHEEGHRRCLHVWENLVYLCVMFRPQREARRFEQELEADDCVSDSGALASALMKVTTDPSCALRAARLQARATIDREGGQPRVQGLDVSTQKGSSDEHA